MKQFLMSAAVIALFSLPVVADDAATAVPADGAITPIATEAPSGRYTLDKYHSTLIFRVSHLGYANYTAQFKTFDAVLDLDVKAPQQSKLEATVDPMSLDIPPPPEGFLDELRGPNWLSAAMFPRMVYRSTSIEMTSPNTARITGEFDFHGVKKPVVLDATFNGGYAGFPLDPHARIGFSAKGSLKRSEFGVAAGIPEPGTNMGVSDAVEIILETEFSGPDWKKPE